MGAIQLAKLTYGADPELFLERLGSVIGSERIIPEEGLLLPRSSTKVIRDGVQVELNLEPDEDRRKVGLEIGNALWALKKRLETTEDIWTTFDPLVTVSEEELQSLSEKSRQAGCMKSYNIYGLPGPEDRLFETYTKRSAGGHIQLGLFEPIFDRSKYRVMGLDENGREERLYDLDNRRKLPFWLDILVGSTCVMLDRMPGAVERRQNYGKAGEFRLPPHGLEYRVLSNFWLTSYQLFGLVTGLSKLAVSAVHTMLLENDFSMEHDLFHEVGLSNVRDTIQENDLLQAHKTWDVVRGFIQKYGENLGNDCGLNPGLLDKFELFVKMVERGGLDAWFKEDPLDHWVAVAQEVSWEEFLEQEVF